MRTLLAFEFKKLLNRRVLWAALALGLALLAWIDLPVVHYSADGSARGWHDTYARYEGQTATEALRKRMREDYESYVAAHPNDFREVWRDEETGEADYSATGYYYGVSDAYNWMNQTQTLEKQQEGYRQIQRRLHSGLDEEGTPLDYQSKRFLTSILPRYQQTPVIHDALAWTKYFSQGGEGLPGMLALAVITLALLGLYNGEASARMEAVVLTSKTRKRLTAAKLMAGGIVAVAVMAFYLALHAGLYVWAYGLTGAGVAAHAVFQAMTTGGLAVWQAGALSWLVKALAVLACASAVVWASAQFRNPLLSLLGAAAVLGATMVGYVAFCVPNYSNIPLLIDLMEYAGRLPLPALMGEVIYDVVRPEHLAFYMGASVLMIALLCALAQRAFLRRRRA